MCMLLSYTKALELVEKYGVRTPKQVIGNAEKILSDFSLVGFPCVLKICRPVHKTDIGGVITHIYDEEVLRRSLDKLKELDNRFVLQEMVKGYEFIIGGKRDPQFGHIIIFGVGGVFTEIYRDITARVAPIRKKDADQMLGEIRGKKLLEGFRGIQVNRKELIDSLVRVSHMLVEEDIEELDINPYILNEKHGYAVDIRVVK